MILLVRIHGEVAPHLLGGLALPLKGDMDGVLPEIFDHPVNVPTGVSGVLVAYELALLLVVLPGDRGIGSAELLDRAHDETCLALDFTFVERCLLKVGLLAAVGAENQLGHLLLLPRRLKLGLEGAKAIRKRCTFLWCIVP